MLSFFQPRDIFLLINNHLLDTKKDFEFIENLIQNLRDKI